MNQVEQRILIIFAPEPLILHRMNPNGETKALPAREVHDFGVRDGASNSVVIEFKHAQASFSHTRTCCLYTFKDFSWQMKYLAENLARLAAGHFGGYADR